MAHTKSALKRARQSEKRRMRNRSVKNRIRTFRLKLRAAVAAQDKATAESFFRTICSLLDKAVKNGVIKSNTADRYKSRDAAVLKKIKNA